MSNFKERIISLKLNVKQHQDQIKILLKEIKDLENYKGNNSNENSTIDNSNLDNFCVSNDIKKNVTKNENLDKFI
jgi:hypothetical protein